MAFTVKKKAFCVLEFAKTEWIVTVQRRFRIMYHTEPPTYKIIREWQPLCWNSCTFTNCFVCRWFCVVHDPKPPLHSHNSLSFGKFQDTERFLCHCERHFYSRLPHSGGTWKYAKAPGTKKKLGEILYLLICSFLPCLPWLLRSRVRKSRRDLWIALYIIVVFWLIYLYLWFPEILRLFSFLKISLNRLKIPRILDNWHINVVRLSALRAGRLYS